MTTAFVVTVVVLAINLPPVNSALLTRLAVLADELFLLTLVVPDGTAVLKSPYACSCFHFGRSRHSPCDFEAINGVR